MSQPAKEGGQQPATVEALLRSARAFLSAADVDAVLGAAAEAARALTCARLSVCGHDLVDGRFRSGATSRAEGVAPCPSEPGSGAYAAWPMALLRNRTTLRYREDDLSALIAAGLLPQGHPRLRGLAGAALLGFDGDPAGFLLVTDAAHGEFTEDDEKALGDLASLASLGLRQVGARADAEAAHRAKSDFLSKMSHEIRSPLSGIIGVTELALLEDSIPSKVREYLRLTELSAKGMLDILNGILDAGRIEAGKFDLRAKPFDLRAVLESVLSILRVVAGRKGVRLSHWVHAETPSVVIGDEGCLRQVLTNLAGNAVKFTEQGLVEVTVRPAPHDSRDPERVRLLFGVKDEGIGIPSQDLTKIFEPYFQTSRSAHSEYGGTGLGLQIAKQLVELMGGTIWAESPAPAPSGRPRDFCRPGGPNGMEPQGRDESGPPRGDHEQGRGSLLQFTAEFALPKTEWADRPTRIPGRVAPSERLRLLVAEDDRLNRVFARELLEKLGHEAVLAGDGEEALRLLSREPFDVVLMDVEMPRMDGDEATKRIRAGMVDGCPPDLPVIALTAHAARTNRERLLAAGMDNYLAKPLDLRDLEKALGRVLESRRGPWVRTMEEGQDSC